MTLTVFSVQTTKMNKSSNGKIVGRTSIGRMRRFCFTNEDGTPADVATAREWIKKMEGFLPPNHTLEVVEKQVEAVPGSTLHFEAKCPDHGPRMNEFFCGMCGRPLEPELKQ